MAVTNGTKIWTNARVYSIRLSRYIYTYANVNPPGFFQAGTIGQFQLVYFVPEANNADCGPIPSWTNDTKSGIATRNNCGTGSTGSSVTYIVPAGTYTSFVSKEDANNKAQADVNTNKQNYANVNGTCTVDKFFVINSRSYHGAARRVFVVPPGKTDADALVVPSDGQLSILIQPGTFYMFGDAVEDARWCYFGNNLPDKFSIMSRTPFTPVESTGGSTSWDVKSIVHAGQYNFYCIAGGGFNNGTITFPGGGSQTIVPGSNYPDYVTPSPPYSAYSVIGESGDTRFLYKNGVQGARINVAVTFTPVDGDTFEIKA